MSRKFKKLGVSIGGVLLSSAVIAAAVPKNVVVFFLPVSDLAHTDSLHESKTTPTRSGTLTSAVTNTLPSDSALKPNPHGMDATVGVSLYDKPAKWTNNQAVDAVLSPAKVMILPPETLKTKRKSKLFSKPAAEANPVQVRIYPLKNSVKAVKAEAKIRPLPFAPYARLTPPVVAENKRPQDKSEWTEWAFGELKECKDDMTDVLSTLHWLMSTDNLSNGRTVCSAKQAVSDYLRKCHPWPAPYYTPTNNDVRRNINMQKSVEIAEAVYGKEKCDALDLSHVNFEKAEFAQGTMAGNNFSNSFFKGAYFLNSDFSEALFYGAELDDVLFKGVNLSKSFFKGAKMRFSHLHSVDASLANFDGADLSNTQFRDAVLTFSSVKDANIANTAWQDVMAYRLNMDNVQARQAVFDNVVLDGAVANKADFTQVTCVNCYMKSVSFEQSIFYKAVFDNAYLDYAVLTRADFRKAVFKGNLIFGNAVFYKADFGGADISAVSDVPLNEIRRVVIDKKTLPPKNFPDFDSAAYDERLYRQKWKNKPFQCSRSACEDVLLGKSGGQNMAVRAMTLLANPPAEMNDRLWAICTLGCLAARDEKLENAAADILAEYVRQQRHWSAQTDLFKPIEPMTDDVALALKALTDKRIRRDLGHPIDLSQTDLRLADLENADLRNVNFAGSYLGGVNMKNAETDAEYDNFDQAVIDEFTRLPAGMASFQPYRLPESEYPDWWKPATVRVLVHGSLPWNQIVETTPLLDEYIAEFKRSAR